MKPLKHLLVAYLVVATFWAAPTTFAQTGTVMPVPRQQFFDNNGKTLAGGLLYTYLAGTTTPQATYSDVGLTTPNANPIVLDSAGRATVFLSATSYKFVLKTSAGVTIWSQDNIASVNLANSLVGLSLKPFFGSPDVPITATSFPSGASYTAFHAGTLIFNIDSANLSGTYALEAMMLGTGGTVSAELVNISDGNPDTAVVTISSVSSTGERVQSSAITFASPGSARNYAIKVKVSAGSGYVWAISLVRVS